MYLQKNLRLKQVYDEIVYKPKSAGAENGYLHVNVS